MEADQFYFQNVDEWRMWLNENHDKAKVVWLIFYKKHTKTQCISYNDAVEQAICFGWIDSIVRRIDDETYIQKFTPRNPKSIWSDTNIRRAKKMLLTGLMNESGLKLLPKQLT